MWMKGKYQLRQAAGQYWLIDMQQSGDVYFPPVGMNESGAIILQRFLETGDVKQSALGLQEEFGIDLQEAETDALAFIEQLRKKGVQI